MLARPSKVDEAAPGIDVYELDAHAIADVEAARAFHDFAFGDWFADSHPRAFVGGAGDDAVELLADAIHQQQSGRSLADLALDLRGAFLLRSAVSSELAELVVGVSRGLSVERGLDQALSDEIREASIR